MNLYHKINKYILERFPTLWNTHFVWMLLLGLVLHFVYFTIGYLQLNVERLKTYGVRNMFFSNSFFSVYVIICLIVFIYFAFRYFTHNPFKNFYPVKQSYFWKILAQLFTIIFLFSTVKISYDNGMIQKANKILPANTFAQEINQINLAYPFLFSDLNQYDILKRTYPKPFPLDDVSEFEIGYDTTTELALKHGIDKTKPYVTLNGTEYQFGNIVTKDIDTCNTETVIENIVDVSQVYGLDELSLYNFSDSYILHSEEVKTNDENVNAWYEIAPTIHTLYKNKDANGIEKILQQLVALCEKYNVSHELQPAKMAKAILEQNLNTHPLIRTGFYDYLDEERNSYDASYAAEEAATSAVDDGITKKAKRLEKLHINYNYSVDLVKFSTMSDNELRLRNNLGFKEFADNGIWVLLFTCLFGALFLIAVKYIPLKELVIGIVVAGILAALLSLIMFSLKNGSENQFLITSIIYATIIIIIGFLNIKKSFLFKWFVPFVVACFAFLPLLLTLIHENTKYRVKTPCSADYSWYHSFDIEAYHIFGLVFISVAVVFIMLRKIHAKAE